MAVVEEEEVEVVICKGFAIYFFWRKQKDMCVVEVVEVAEVVICKGFANRYNRNHPSTHSLRRLSLTRK